MFSYFSYLSKICYVLNCFIYFNVFNVFLCFLLFLFYICVCYCYFHIFMTCLWDVHHFWVFFLQFHQLCLNTSGEPPGNLRGTSGELPGNLRGTSGELPGSLLWGTFCNFCSCLWLVRTFWFVLTFPTYFCNVSHILYDFVST